jgi:hypothetical protein
VDNEGALTSITGMKVSPGPDFLDSPKRYKSVLNIEKNLIQMRGSLTTHINLQMKDVNQNGWGEPISLSKGLNFH